MTDFKALHEELTQWFADEMCTDAWFESHKDALLTALELAQQVEMLQAVIARANNSLYGSDNFFLSMTGGEPEERHLADGIEILKQRANEARAENASLKAQLAECEQVKLWSFEQQGLDAQRIVELEMRLAAKERGSVI